MSLAVGLLEIFDRQKGVLNIKIAKFTIHCNFRFKGFVIFLEVFSLMGINPLSRLVRGLIGVFKRIKFGLQGKGFKRSSSDDVFSLRLFGFHCSIDWPVRFNSLDCIS